MFSPRHLAALLAAAAATASPLSAIAANSLDLPQAQCSGALDASFAAGVTLSCAGDYSLGDGSITSDHFIAISATGSITIGTVAFNAPTTRITGKSEIVFGSIGGAGSLVFDGPVTLGSSPLLPGNELPNPGTSGGAGSGLIVVGGSGSITLGRTDAVSTLPLVGSAGTVAANQGAFSVQIASAATLNSPSLDVGSFTQTPQAPEPTSLALAAIGLAAVAYVAMRSNAQQLRTRPLGRAA